MRSSKPREHTEKLTEARLSNPGQYIQGIGANRDPLDALSSSRASLMAQLVKNPLAGQETPVWFLSWEDPQLVLSWKVYPLQYSGLENSMDCIVYGSQRIGHDWVITFFIQEDRLSINVNSGLFGGSDGKESACDAGDLDSISGLGRYPEEGNG